MRERISCGFARWSCWIFRDPQTGWFFLDSSRILLGSWILIPAEILGSTGRLIADILFLILDPDFLKSRWTQDLVNSSWGQRHFKVNTDNSFEDTQDAHVKYFHGWRPFYITVTTRYSEWVSGEKVWWATWTPQSKSSWSLCCLEGSLLWKGWARYLKIFH